MKLAPVQALHHTAERSCQSCGRREALPREAAELQRHLRLRLMQLTRAREATEAPLRTFKSMNETWPFAIAVMSLMGIFQSWRFLDGWRAAGAFNYGKAMFGVVPLAGAIAVLAGWLGMRRTFARILRPLLRARPPQAPGLAARCRNCGGDLPSVRTHEVTCQYCSASNFLDAELTEHASALLAAEASAFQQRALPWARDPQVYLAPARAFYGYAAVGGALALGLGALLLAMI